MTHPVEEADRFPHRLTRSFPLGPASRALQLALIPLPLDPLSPCPAVRRLVAHVKPAYSLFRCLQLAPRIAQVTGG
jgi:hypothetical protein